MEPLYRKLLALLVCQYGYQNKRGKGLNGLIIIINAAMSLAPVDIMAFQEKPSINGKGGTLNTTYPL